MARKNDWRNKARFFEKNALVVGKGVLVILIIVMLFRFVISKDFGWSMDFFVEYSDGSGLYYFDFFGWLKNCGVLLSNFKNVVNSLFNSFDGFWSDDWVSNFVNCLILPLNIILALVKVIICVPLVLIGVFFGGPFGSWSLPGGWLYQFISFNIPYMALSENWWLNSIHVL